MIGAGPREQESAPLGRALDQRLVGLAHPSNVLPPGIDPHLVDTVRQVPADLDVMRDQGADITAEDVSDRAPGRLVAPHRARQWRVGRGGRLRTEGANHLRDELTGNRPAGLFAPASVCAIAVPPSSPAYQASRIALA